MGAWWSPTVRATTVAEHAPGAPRRQRRLQPARATIWPPHRKVARSAHRAGTAQTPSASSAGPLVSSYAACGPSRGLPLMQQSGNALNATLQMLTFEPSGETGQQLHDLRGETWNAE